MLRVNYNCNDSTEFFPTPKESVRKLWELLPIKLESGMTVFDPCAGECSLTQFLPNDIKVINWDLNPRRENVEQHDSLAEEWPKADIVVCNPPFQMCNEFFRKCNHYRHQLLLGPLASFKRMSNLKSVWLPEFNDEQQLLVKVYGVYRTNQFNLNVKSRGVRREGPTLEGLWEFMVEKGWFEGVVLTDHDLGPDYDYCRSTVNNRSTIRTFEKVKTSMDAHNEKYCYAVPLKNYTKEIRDKISNEYLYRGRVFVFEFPSANWLARHGIVIPIAGEKNSRNSS